MSSLANHDTTTSDNTHTPQTKKKNVRHAEKRRTSTCAFADRVARVSIDHYHQVIPEWQRPPQTCLATIVAFFLNEDGDDNDDEGRLQVLSMGVGTKFLPESILQIESTISHGPKKSMYGQRVRDCHAEVLARRGFRRYLTLEMLRDLKKTRGPRPEEEYPGILVSSTSSVLGIQYRLRPGVSLHFYTSSAPCGNATLKKFAKMSKEEFRYNLGPSEWPLESHEPIHASSIPLGQFALLIKKDQPSSNSSIIIDEDQNSDTSTNHDTTTTPKLLLSIKERSWPANQSDDWTPPGTTIVSYWQKGSIHSCSDKICRWNFLGLQGSLLSSFLEAPLYATTFTVGRKFTECICRRALCCRMELANKATTTTKSSNITTQVQQQQQPLVQGNDNDHDRPIVYQVNHPAIMGTAVYMDETGVVETRADTRGQDVRFHSSQAWCWWLDVGHEDWNSEFAIDIGQCECIDGSTGFLFQTTSTTTMNDDYEDEDSEPTPFISKVSTEALTRLFLQVYTLACQHQHGLDAAIPPIPSSLQDLHSLKRRVSPNHEEQKEHLFSTHRIFRYWRRR